MSKSKPVYGDYLVLDGSMSDYSIERAIEYFNTNNYKLIFTTGGKLSVGYYLEEKKTLAELTRATFLELGFDSTKVIAIPGETVLRNRTYTSGLTLKSYFEEQNIKKAKVDVVSTGCHSRRSMLLFQKALGDNFEVGVFAIEDNSYELKKWWKTSRGARTVISETIAFFYSKFFFYPRENQNPT
ncbi:ElyC/SanA/YdcF family protein [Maribellus maritimus]|uniref:ElyC/SanA/YdcF family protein n=1 Tax=Maribellus maritimus TaxID=2870838 RepID=UPI001EEAD95D|nr:ElyC/SanA/YdcF family protein [Maribellus maritimus]MCG6186916.1 YdcF family protein [Maribellus maritimus]